MICRLNANRFNPIDYENLPVFHVNYLNTHGVQKLCTKIYTLILGSLHFFSAFLLPKICVFHVIIEIKWNSTCACMCACALVEPGSSTEELMGLQLDSIVHSNWIWPGRRHGCQRDCNHQVWIKPKGLRFEINSVLCIVLFNRLIKTHSCIC